MARNKTLGFILDLVRSEARLSVNPAHNAQSHDTQVRLIRRIYDELWEGNVWPHLVIRRTYQLQDGQKLYDFAPDFDISRIEHIYVKDGGEWAKLRPEIAECDYSEYDSDLDERAWPARAWRLYEDEKVEIWPIPDQNGDAATLDGYIKVVGVGARPAFVEDTDICVLDDRLIALYAAAELFFADGNEKMGSIKFQLAEKRKLSILGNVVKKRTVKLFGGSQPAVNPRMFPHYTDGDAI